MVKDVGMIERPNIMMRVIDWASDKFVNVATNGVWEFLLSKDAVNIVGRHLYGETTNDGKKISKGHGDNDDYANRGKTRNGGGGGGRGGGSGSGGASVACKTLIKAALVKWHDCKGDYCNVVLKICLKPYFHKGKHTSIQRNQNLLPKKHDDESVFSRFFSV
jgi:hypothetical protein